MDNIEQKIEEAARLATALKYVAIFMAIPPKAGSSWKASFADVGGVISGLLGTKPTQAPEGTGNTLHAAVDDLTRQLKSRIADEMSKHETTARELRSVLNPRD